MTKVVPKKSISFGALSQKQQITEACKYLGVYTGNILEDPERSIPKEIKAWLKKHVVEGELIDEGTGVELHNVEAAIEYLESPKTIKIIKAHPYIYTTLGDEDFTFFFSSVPLNLSVRGSGDMGKASLSMFKKIARQLRKNGDDDSDCE